MVRWHPSRVVALDSREAKELAVMPFPPAPKFEHAGWCNTHYSSAANCSCGAEAQQSAYDRGWNEAVEELGLLAVEWGSDVMLDAYYRMKKP